MFHILPDDILIYISEKLNLNKRIIFFDIINFKNNHKECLNLLVRRIQLFYIISLNVRKIKYNQVNFIRKIFEKSYKPLTDDRCWLYSPFVQNGICRICFQNESRHILNEKCSNILIKLYQNEIYSYI